MPMHTIGSCISETGSKPEVSSRDFLRSTEAFGVCPGPACCGSCLQRWVTNQKWPLVCIHLAPIWNQIEASVGERTNLWLIWPWAKTHQVGRNPQFEKHCYAISTFCCESWDLLKVWIWASKLLVLIPHQRNVITKVKSDKQILFFFKKQEFYDTLETNSLFWGRSFLRSWGLFVKLFF